jgi:exonuclease SbcD
VRIIHTADWHLCNRLGRIDRTHDLRRRVEKVAALCEVHAADVLIIAGDIFSEYADQDDIHQSFNHLQDVFAPFFKRGGTILAVTGNHDRDAKINMVRSGMSLASPFARSADGRLAGGRMYLNNGRGFARLADRDGQAVQFVFVPYPFPSRYNMADAEILAKEQLHNRLHGEVAHWLQKAIFEKEGFNSALHTVLIGHLHIRGGQVHSLYKLTEADDVLFDFADLNPNWAYVALGHIHKPQAVNGERHVRYPGSLDALDHTEVGEGYTHGVILFDIGPKGLVADPQFLEIPHTPFHNITLTNLDEELPALAEKYPGREDAIVRVQIVPHGHTISRDEASRHLRKLFPRLHQLDWLRPDRPDSEPSAGGVSHRASLEETVRSYVTNRDDFKAESAAEQKELLALLDGFLQTGGAA